MGAEGYDNKRIQRHVQREGKVTKLVNRHNQGRGKEKEATTVTVGGFCSVPDAYIQLSNNPAHQPLSHGPVVRDRAVNQTNAQDGQPKKVGPKCIPAETVPSTISAGIW